VVWGRELEPLKVLVGSDMAFEAGRCKMLVPTATGNAARSAAKYVIIYSRQTQRRVKRRSIAGQHLSLNAGTEVDPRARLGQCRGSEDSKAHA